MLFSGILVLGICFGWQLISKVLGGKGSAGHSMLNALTYAVRGKVVLKYTARLILIQVTAAPCYIP